MYNTTKESIIMWILAEDPGAVINLNYVSKIYMEYGIKDGERHKLLADYKNDTICLVSYETEEELQKAIERLAAEMARTGIGISIRMNKEETDNGENTVELKPINIKLPIKIDEIFNDLTSENKMFFMKSLLPLMTNEDLTSLIKIIQSQISKSENK